MSPEELQQRYCALLTAYSREPSEELLHQAQQLGRKMVAQQFSPEIIADMHNRAMLAVRDAEPQHDCHQLITTGSRVLSEVLMSYGLAFRSSQCRQELEEDLQLASKVVENTQDGVIITDLDGHIIRVNPAFCTVTGYSAEEVIGKTPAVLQSGRQDRRFYRNMWQALQKEGRWAGKIWNRRKNGDIYPEHLSITTTYDRHGQPTHRVGVFSDLSEQEALEEQLRQSSKMESIGTLVGGIAHDFNNMLAGLSGNIYLMGKKIPAGDPLHNRLEQMESICSRATEMIAQLLVFARKGAVDMHPLPLTSFIKEAIKLARVTVPENIDFCYTVVDESLVIRGDTTQLQQVILNLLNNARDAASGVEQPAISLTLSRYVADDGFYQRHPECVDDPCDFAHLCVQDNGVGIPKEMLSHVFEPFFTTKEEGRGTGLGLSMVYGAMQSHRGVIEVESLCNFGTKFHLYFPLLNGTDNEGGDGKQRHQSEVQRATTAQTLLLADDNISVRTTTAEVLEDLGYRVLTASDGEEAWALFQSQPQGSIALVMLDVVMPRIDGLQLAKLIRQQSPEQPILFATGYDKTRLAYEADDGISDIKVLAKPLNFDTLSAIIEAVAGKERSS